jgi:hypothetical protein
VALQMRVDGCFDTLALVALNALWLLSPLHKLQMRGATGLGLVGVALVPVQVPGSHQDLLLGLGASSWWGLVVGACWVVRRFVFGGVGVAWFGWARIRWVYRIRYTRSATDA